MRGNQKPENGTWNNPTKLHKTKHLSKEHHTLFVQAEIYTVELASKAALADFILSSMMCFSQQ